MNPEPSTPPEPETPAESQPSMSPQVPPAVPVVSPAEPVVPVPHTPTFTPQVITPAGYPSQAQFSMNQVPATHTLSAPANSTVVTVSTGRRKKLLVIITAAAAVLALGGGYVFGVYLPNTPGAVFASSLTNTAKGIDQLIAYSKQQQQVAYTSSSFTGTLNLKSPSGSFDFNLNGLADKDTNATVSFSSDIMGEKVTGNIRSVHTAGQTTPDIYVQVNGIKSYLDANGLNALDNLDGQWIAIDHTLIDTYESALTEGSNTAQPAVALSSPTSAQLQDVETRVQVVNKQYLFTEDPAKAVLANEKFLGKDRSGGRSLDHYIVGYNKAHLEAYVTALGGALDASSLNAWSKQVYGKNLSQEIDITSLETTVRNAKSDYTFDLWADTATKLVSKLAFTDPATKYVMTLSQGYTGGSQFPLGLWLAGKSSTGDVEDTQVNLTMDTKTNNVAVSLADSTQSSAGTTTVSGNFTATPGKTAVKVSAPAGAKSVVDILNSLGLGSLLSGGNGATADGSLSPQVLQQ